MCSTARAPKSLPTTASRRPRGWREGLRQRRALPLRRWRAELGQPLAQKHCIVDDTAIGEADPVLLAARRRTGRAAGDEVLGCPDARAGVAQFQAQVIG